MIFSSCDINTVSFINKEGVELFQIGKDKTESHTYDTVYIKDNNRVAVSSGGNAGKTNRYIVIIDIESKKVMTTISMDTDIYGMAVRCRTIYYWTVNKGLNLLNLSDKSEGNGINSDILQR